MEELPFESGSFDAIHCRGVLMHIPNWEAALRNLCRVLKPGGRIALLENNDASFYFRLAAIAKALKGEDVRRTQAGVEFWSTCDGLPFVARKANVGSLARAFTDLGLRTVAVFPTGFLEIAHFPAGVVRNSVISLNRFWFARSLPWRPSADIAIVGEKL
jgi:SAM-dependent methyltransferase